MIEFDSINFQWETEGEKKRLIIMVRGIDDWPQEQKKYFEDQLKNAIKPILNAGI